MFSLFPPKDKSSYVTQQEENDLYRKSKKFIPFLPMVEYQTDSKTFLFDDERSVGIAFEVKPCEIDGRSAEFMASVRDKMVDVLQGTFDEDETAPWVVTQYSYDSAELDSYVDHLENYCHESTKGSKLTEDYISVMRQHYRAIAKDGGLFEDEIIQTRLQGRIRKNILIVYRILPEKFVSKKKMTPEEEINEIAERLIMGFKPIGIHLKRFTGKMMYDWLLRWFNPNPKLTGQEKVDFYNSVQYTNNEDLPFGSDFSTSLFFSRPRSDADKGAWYFDEMPHRLIRVSSIAKKPTIGMISGEVTFGNAKFNMMDHLPVGSIWINVMVIEPQDMVESHVANVKQRATGENGESKRAERDCDEIQELMGDEHKLYRSWSGVYAKATDEKKLSIDCGKICSQLINFGLKPVYEHEESVGLDTYILGLPFCYNPVKDKYIKLAKLTWVQHIANMSSFYGRNIGTGNPLFNFFNRGASPMCCDPFNIADRKTNGHGLIIGPTGSGKSALITYLAASMMAIIKPRLFIVEVGNSFGLLGQYFEKMGLKVNRVRLAPGQDVHIPPFADAHLLLESKKKIIVDIDDEKTPIDHIPTEDDDEFIGDDQRDVMGEMELLAILMITGGNENEYRNFTRPDRRLVRNAILSAAKKSKQEDRQCLTEDVRDALLDTSNNPELRERKSERAEDMADALSMFCDGFEGELFNTEGTPWPDADVTIIDLATFAREGYEAQLAVAYSSLMMRINNIAEKHQYDERPLIQITDEGHIITTNPLLSPFIVKVVKMWRKLGAWWWVATQNLEDFPDISKKLLNMVEWWLCLVMPKEEVDQISRFRELNSEQRGMFIDARKENKKYTEGVILSKQFEMLFKVVPPSLYLSLAGTEKDEKTERAQLMKEHNISEVEAAFLVAKKINKLRGIE